MLETIYRVFFKQGSRWFLLALSGFLASLIACSKQAPGKHATTPQPKTDDQSQNLPITPNMRAAYNSFSALQEFLADPTAFEASENQQKIGTHLTALRTNFHGVSNLPSKYSESLDFKNQIELISEVLSDAENAILTKRPAWAYWRLRGVSSNCLSCHLSHNVGGNFSTKTLDSGSVGNINSLSKEAQGEFFLATRQYALASAALLDAASAAYSNKEDHIAPLKKWLLASVKSNTSPKVMEFRLRKFLKSGPKWAQRELSKWSRELKAWDKELSTNKQQPDIEKAFLLLENSAELSEPLAIANNQVALIRASSIAHEYLDANDGSLQSASADTQAQIAGAYYLLGVCYAKMPFVFAQDLPGLFLRQAIEAAPGSTNAKNAYELLKEFTALGFTGSSGTSLPAEVLADLQSLRKKAYLE